MPIRTISLCAFLPWWQILFHLEKYLLRLPAFVAKKNHAFVSKISSRIYADVNQISGEYLIFV